jgi:lysophospholipase L1-like esterase
VPLRAAGCSDAVLNALRFLSALWDENLALLLLAPLFLLEGLYARAATAKLPEAAGARTGRAGSGPALRILIVGDSAAAGVGVERQEDALSGQLVRALESRFSVQWKLMARTGATTESALLELEQSQAEKFDVALISLGVNDVTASRSLGEWLLLQKRLVDLLRQGSTVRLVLLTALPPMHKFTALLQPLRWFLGRRARKFTVALRTFAETQPDCAIVEFGDITQPGMLATDGFHPSIKTYAVWGQAAADLIVQRAASHLP